MGNIIYAGVDYGLIVEKAESEADILLWDGGNNDFPFIKPDLHLVLTDPLRPGDESNYHPGETVLRMADIVIIPKSDVAKAEDITKVTENVRKINPHAQIIQTASPITLDDPDAVRDRRVLVIEDGPTTTHGGMGYGAGYVAAIAAKVAEIIDPRPFAVPDIAKIYQAYPHLHKILPAMGYFPTQLQALQDTINQSDADIVISATPSDLSALIEVNKPIIRARYELAEMGKPELTEAIQQFLERRLPSQIVSNK
jgi:predicted GTPase